MWGLVMMKMEKSGAEPLDGGGGGGVPWRLVGMGGLAALAVLFVFQNTGKGEVNFLFWDIKAPAWLWLASTFAVGVIVGLMLPGIRARRAKKKAKAKDRDD
jgi:uncharacterized integral membrane protein